LLNAIDFALNMARLKLSTEERSGRVAPLATQTPISERATSTRLPAASMPRAIKSSALARVTIATSAASPPVKRVSSCSDGPSLTASR
jgi:hypothetical protein